MKIAAARGFDNDTSRSLGYLLRDISRRILRLTTERLEPFGISLPQYFALRELWQEEGLTQRELANRVGILEPTMVSTIDALECAGLVVRSRSRDDRRKTHVLLTERGRGLSNEALGIAADVLDSALAGVGSHEIVAMRDVLQRMKSNLAPGAAHKVPSKL
jgi:DNA-binding MarR family transcriptional regulator